MSPEEIKKLLGGYATGTLTAEEQQALFAAALEDQELFDALANEQPLRDLLSDPAARAVLLSSLDTPADRLGGFWEWLRRPAVTGLAAAVVVAIAVVAVWQDTRGARPKLPQRTAVIAELRPQEPGPATAPAEIPSATVRSEAGKRNKVAQIPPPTRMVDEKATAAIGPPPAPPPPPPGLQALRLRQVETDAPVPAMAAPPPPASAAAPAPAPKKDEGGATAPSAQPVPQVAAALADSVSPDARALFYANQVAQGANAFVPSSGAKAAAAPPVRPLSAQADAAPRAEKALAGSLASVAAAVRLGVRISILRGAGEADLTTVLDPGETVRLKLIPNADGYLYIADGARLVASGAVQRFKPFETPELPFQGSGQKQLYVMFSRRPQTVDPESLGTVARGNLVRTSAERERATYVVSGLGDAATLQVIVPVTLTYQ